MGDAIGLIALVLLLGAAVGAVAWWVGRDKRVETREARETTAAARSAAWEVGQEGGRGQFGPAGAGAVTRIFLRCVAPDGAEIDRIAVADVPSNDPEWNERVLEARLTAGRRAVILNTEP